MILVDYDPDGLSIFRCYRYGSSNQTSIGNPGAQLLGIKTQQVLELQRKAPKEDSGSYQASTTRWMRSSVSSTSCRDPITQLTPRDRKLALSTLDSLYDLIHKENESVELVRELQTMLMLGVKAEIQWLDESGSLATWLDERLGTILEGRV